MDEQATLRALLDLAESLGITIRSAPAMSEGATPGGALVRVRDREILFLDAAASAPDRIAVVAGALAGRSELEKMFLPPQIREVLDRAAPPPQRQP